MDTDFIENALDSSGAASSSSSLYAECREITAVLPSAPEARQAPPAKANVGNPQNAAGTTTSTRMYSYVIKPSEVASDGTNGSPGSLRQPLTRTVSSGPQTQQLTEYEYVDVPAVPPRKVRPASVRLPVSVLERPDSVSYVSSSNDASASDGAPLPNFKPVVPQRNFVVNSSKPHSAAAPLPLRDPRDSSTTAKPTPSASSDVYAEATYQRPPTLPDRRPAAAAAAAAAAESSDDSDGIYESYTPLRSPETIEQWLSDIKLPQYIDVFNQTGWDHVRFVGVMTRQDLDDIGITDGDHQSRILHSIEILNALS